MKPIWQQATWLPDYRRRN